MKILSFFITLLLLNIPFNPLYSEEICQDIIFHRYYLQRAWDEWNNNIFFNKALEVLEKEKAKISSDECKAKIELEKDSLLKRVETFKYDAFNYYPLIPLLSDKFINHRLILPPEQIAIEDGMAEVRTVLEKRLIREGQLPVIILGKISNNNYSEFDLAFRGLEGRHPFAPYPKEEIIQNLGDLKESDLNLEYIKNNHQKVLKGFFDKDNWQSIYILNINNKLRKELIKEEELEKYRINLENEAYYVLDVYKVSNYSLNQDKNLEFELVASADTTGVRTVSSIFKVILFSFLSPIIYFLIRLILLKLFTNKIEDFTKLAKVYWLNMLISFLGMILFLKFIPSLLPDSVVNLKNWMGVIYTVIVFGALIFYIPFLNLLLSKFIDLTTILNNKNYYEFFITSIFNGLSFTMIFYTLYFIQLNQLYSDSIYIILFSVNRTIPGIIFSYGTLNINKIHQISNSKKEKRKKGVKTQIGILLVSLFLYSIMVVMFYHNVSESILNRDKIESILLIINIILIIIIINKFRNLEKNYKDIIPESDSINKSSESDVKENYLVESLKNDAVFVYPTNFKNDIDDYYNIISKNSLFMLEVIGSPDSGKKKFIVEFSKIISSKFIDPDEDKEKHIYRFDMNTLHHDSFLDIENKLKELKEIKSSITLLKNIEALTNGSTEFTKIIPFFGEFISKIISIKIPNLDESIKSERMENISKTIVKELSVNKISILEFYNYHEGKSESKEIVKHLIEHLSSSNMKVIVIIHFTLKGSNQEYKSEFEEKNLIKEIYDTNKKGFSITEFYKLFFTSPYYSKNYKENYDFFYKFINVFEKDNKILISNFLEVHKNLLKSKIAKIEESSNKNETFHKINDNVIPIPISKDHFIASTKFKERTIVHIAGLLSESFDFSFFMALLKPYSDKNPEFIEPLFTKEGILEINSNYSNKFSRSEQRIFHEKYSNLINIILENPKKEDVISLKINIKNQSEKICRFKDPIFREYIRNNLFNSEVLLESYKEEVIRLLKEDKWKHVRQMESANLIELLFLKNSPAEKDFEFLLELFKIAYFYGDNKEYLVIYLLKFKNLLIEKQKTSLYSSLLDVISLYFTDDYYILEDPKVLENRNNVEEVDAKNALDFIEKMEIHLKNDLTLNKMEREPLLQFYLVFYQNGKHIEFENKIEKLLKSKNSLWMDYYDKFYLRIKAHRFKREKNVEYSEYLYKESFNGTDALLNNVNTKLESLNKSEQCEEYRELLALKARILQNKCQCSYNLNKSTPLEDWKKLIQLRLELYDLSGLFYTLRLFSKIEYSNNSGIKKEYFPQIIKEIGEETCNRYIFKEVKNSKTKEIQQDLPE